MDFFLSMGKGSASPETPPASPDSAEGAAEGAAEDAAARPKDEPAAFSFRVVMALHIVAGLLFLAMHGPLLAWTKNADLSKVKQQLEDVKPS